MRSLISAALVGVLLAGCRGVPQRDQPAPRSQAKPPAANKVAAAPDNKPAKQAPAKKAPKQEPLPEPKGPDSPSGDLAVQVAKANVEIDRALIESRKAHQGRKFPLALKQLDLAIDRARWLRAKASGSAERVAKLQALRSRIARDQEDWKRGEAVRLRTLNERRAEQERRAEARRLGERVERLMREASLATQRERYGEAVQLYGEVLRIDPSATEAQRLYNVALDARHHHERTILRRELVRQHQALALKTDRAALYQTRLSEHPSEEEWAEIKKRRPVGSASGAMQVEDSETLAIREKLEQKLSVDFSQTPLEDVVAFVRQTVGVNLVIDPKVNDELDADQKLVDLTLKGVSAKELLGLLTDLKRLRWGITQGVVMITTRAD